MQTSVSAVSGASDLTGVADLVANGRKVRIAVLLAIILVLRTADALAAVYTGGSYGGYAPASLSPRTLNGSVPDPVKYYGGSFQGYSSSPFSALLNGGSVNAAKFYGGSYDGNDAYNLSILLLDGTIPPNMPIFALSRDSLLFDGVAVGNSKKDSVTVANEGGQLLTVSTVTLDDPQYTVSPASASIPTFTQRSFVITFAPTSPGSVPASASFAHNAAGSPDTVAVRGTGVPAGTITGTLFADLNSNGVKDAGDSALSAWTIRLNGGATATTTTDPGGNYSFTGLSAGSYTVSEDLQPGWLQTHPVGSGTHTVNLGNADIAVGIDFGDTYGLQFVGSDSGSWSNPLNWSLHATPGPGDNVFIPCGILVLMDILPSDSIHSLRICHDATLHVKPIHGTLRIKTLAQIDPGGTLSFTPGDDSSGMIFYKDFLNKGTLAPGNSTITFAGDEQKSIVTGEAATAPTTFHTLVIAGSNTGTIGNIVVENQLVLHNRLFARAQDTVDIIASSPGAIADTGIIPLGTIKRAIAPGELNPYRFESPGTFIQFNGSGTYPSTVKMKAMPDSTNCSFGLNWQLVGGTVDSINNTVRKDSIGAFSKWALGRPHPTQAAAGIPEVTRLYRVETSGGSNFLAKLSLRYDQSELPNGISESSLQLMRGPMFLDTVHAGWNMVSLPGIPEINLRSDLFPSSGSAAFAYAGTYEQRPALSFGEGYWMKFGGTQLVPIVAADLGRDTITVSSGWNMIGSVSYPVSGSGIIPLPPVAIRSSVFGYSGGYYRAATLNPGQAYWIKVASAGKMILDAQLSCAIQPQNVKGGTSAANRHEDPLANLSTLRIRSAGGDESTLRFSSQSEGVELAEIELPPLPPGGVADARFATNRDVALAAAGKITETPIIFSSMEYPVVIAWNVKTGDDGATLILDGRPIELAGEGSVRVATEASRMSLRLGASPVRDVPREFALEQNYPNPFNPVTVIRYQVPAASRITLSVYNILGQKVATLVDAVQDVGYKSVSWDGTGAASGVYYYRIEAARLSAPGGSFTSVKKMVLLK